MLKEFAWSAFEKTGSVDAYVFYKEIEAHDKIQENNALAKEEVAASK
ncbi:YqzL family protein [Clostridium thermosuccinogenes]|jgi:hypothetical protein|uniref:YqzL family protein n=1 Tax=Clostridium thermosuccinogenes TaxID=84032 RepID=A0A2K2F2F1_9CLOT|nr:YqzL family protein [Pseudoclostridium thermosuccinogenes]AUS96392.1 YqzL family protein [Pseudoclostridium thermosuccinogenes]PNT92942.1 YqzL family protein [Pseudoclostridium thermosuccinogenes]PNT95658.1 YqzL family protein [Pseudoclostridium thermosuccinogenes]PNT96881.1 YqzL family protein [Pseudoclostridium thermosuccinogenes]